MTEKYNWKCILVMAPFCSSRGLLSPSGRVVVVLHTRFDHVGYTRIFQWLNHKKNIYQITKYLLSKLSKFMQFNNYKIND